MIVGGGPAGLSAGIYARLSGYSCTIVEKNRIVGGNLTSWKRNNCEIDNCLHWLIGTRDGNKMNRIWHDVGMLGVGVKIYRGEAFYKSEYKGKTISLYRNTELLRREMHDISPKDTKEINKFINTVNAVAKWQINGKISPTLISSLMYYMGKNLYELSCRFSHPHLKRLITDYLGKELSSLGLIFSYANFSIGNADVPYGSSRQAAERMKTRFLSLGGKILSGTEVSKLDISSGNEVSGIMLSDGRMMPADAVVICCDPSLAFGKMLPKKYTPRVFSKAKREMHTFSALHAAFVCDAKSVLPKCTTVIESEEFGIESRRINRMIVKPYSSERGFDIPEGKVVLQTIFYLHDEESRRWIRLARDKKAYSELKKKFAHVVQKHLKTRYPQISDSLKLLDVWTPYTYKKYFGNENGAFMSFALLNKGALLYRLPGKVKKIKNLFLASQWQSSPGGLPTAAAKGKYVVKLLQKKLGSPSEYAFDLRYPVKSI